MVATVVAQGRATALATDVTARPTRDGTAAIAVRGVTRLRATVRRIAVAPHLDTTRVALPFSSKAHHERRPHSGRTTRRGGAAYQDRVGPAPRPSVRGGGRPVTT